MPIKRSRIKLPPDEYKKLVIKVFQRDRKCRVCKSRKSLHAHHIIYRSMGGDDIMENLLTLCLNCHEAAHRNEILILSLNGSLDGIPNANEGVKVYFTKKRKVV